MAYGSRTAVLKGVEGAGGPDGARAAGRSRRSLRIWTSVRSRCARGAAGADGRRHAPWARRWVLSFVLDVYSRRCVGWQLSGNMRTDLVLDALKTALGTRRHGADLELVHHSDRGSQPGLNRSSQQFAFDDGLHGSLVTMTRLSSRRLAQRAGRSGDSRARAGCAPSRTRLGLWGPRFHRPGCPAPDLRPRDRARRRAVQASPVRSVTSWSVSLEPTLRDLRAITLGHVER